MGFWLTVWKFESWGTVTENIKSGWIFRDNMRIHRRVTPGVSLSEYGNNNETERAMSTMITRVAGHKVEMNTRYHTAGAMTTLMQMVQDNPDTAIYEVFSQRPGGSDTVGFLRDAEYAAEFADSLGGSHDFQRVYA